MGLRPMQMAGHLGLTLAEYRALEAGELNITFDLYERIVELCGWLGRRRSNIPPGGPEDCRTRRLSSRSTISWRRSTCMRMCGSWA